MEKRWMLSFDGGVTFDHQAHPLHSQDLSIDSSRDLDKGQIFFRDKLSGPLRFKGEDYQLLLGYEASAALRCTPILVRLDLKCSGAWETKWTGRFAASNGTWDFTKCIYEAKPETVDRYTCILGRDKVKRNILEAQAVPNRTKILPRVDFMVCSFTTTGPGLCPEIGNDDDDPLFIYGWEYVDDYVTWIDGNEVVYNLYWRERATTTCVDGLPNQPDGTGWPTFPYENNCATLGTCDWVRRPQVFYPFSSPVQGTFDGEGNPVAPDDSCNWLYVGTVWVMPAHIPSASAPYFICLDESSPQDIQYNRSRTLESVADLLLDKMECGLDKAHSDFFEWAAIGDAPGYSPGINYITGTTNPYDGLLILQKSDAINPQATNPATNADMTFDELANALRVMFRVWWDIDDEGRLRFEHWNYWSAGSGINLANEEGVVERMVYTSEALAPQVERAAYMEALSRDFVGVDIIYSGPCVDQEKAEEYSPGKITTEISYIASDPADISKEGFVILAAKWDAVDNVYRTQIAVGSITGVPLTNAHLSWANLEASLWLWDRFLPTANMNGQDVDFPAYLPNAGQEPVSFTMCCKTFDFDPRKTVSGKMAARMGVPGVVKDASFNLRTGRIELELEYAH